MPPAEQPTAPSMTFAYRASSDQGACVTGTIEAAGLEHAQRLLATMGLQVVEVQALPPAARPQALRGTDLLAFNEQLAHLTQAGLPVERGLRLIAAEMRNARLAQTVRQIADEAERGVPLAQAFEAHRGKLPQLYCRLVEAGVRTGNLPAMLFNLGRHLDLLQRLRASVWRALAYPAMVFVGMSAVLIFISFAVIPGYRKIYDDFGTNLPALTELVFVLARWMPAILIGLIALVIATPVLWRVLQSSGRDQMVLDALGLPLPLLGPILQRNLIARWCDAVYLSVTAGLDLPKAIELADEAIASPLVTADGDKLIEALSKGGTLSSAGPLNVLTDSVTAAMDLACEGRDLPATLATLSQMYQQQADVRVSMVNIILTPILLAVMAISMGLLVVSLFLPLISITVKISEGH